MAWSYGPRSSGDDRAVAGAQFPAGYPPAVSQWAVSREQLQRFLAVVQRDPALKQRLVDAITADEVAMLAQDMGYAVSGSDILRFNGQSAAGVRVTRIDHPGEYPGRYV